MKDLETAMSEAGFTISDDAPTQETSQENVQNQEQAQQSTAPVEDVAPQPERQPSPEPELVAQPPVQQTQEPSYTQTEQVTKQENFSESELENEVLRYMSERLGSQYDSFDSFKESLNKASLEIDERVAAINNFVRETGRSPEDWYAYQRLNTSEMDDLTAVRNQMKMEHANLSSEEVDMLIGNKYKLDPDLNTEQDVKMAQLQLKMDAEQARRSLEDIRSKYEAPEVQSNEPQSFITDEWVSTMRKEVNSLDGLVIGLPNGSQFTYGLNNKYKDSLIEKNSRLDYYFDDYINSSGDWNFDKLSSHRALIDNIDEIVSSVYRQGVSDGQRKVVQTAGNVSTDTRPQQSIQQNTSSRLEEQLREAFGGNNGLTFKF